MNEVLPLLYLHEAGGAPSPRWYGPVCAVVWSLSRLGVEPTD
jgi:hypothetical protein